jgi:hypothetical protein
METPPANGGIQVAKLDIQHRRLPLLLPMNQHREHHIAHFEPH